MIDFGEDRRLSIRRLIIAVVSCALFLATASWYVARAIADIYTHTKGGNPTWFAPYVNVALKPTVFFEGYDNPLLQNIVLGSVVAASSNACVPSWGTRYDLDAAARALDLDRRLVRFRERGGTAIISFGGGINSEIATVCESSQEIAAAYRRVVERYGARIVDFHMRPEVLAQQTPPSIERRVAAIAALARAHPSLEVWLTLPATTSGLTSEAQVIVAEVLAAKLEPAGINVMAMNYGQGKPAQLSMGKATIYSLTMVAAQLKRLYAQAEKPLTEQDVWNRMGVMPMIGQNDIAEEVLTLRDAKDLLDFMEREDLARASFWSINRDVPCGGNVETKQALDTCSGVNQESLQFSRMFVKRFPNSARRTDRSETNDTEAGYGELAAIDALSKDPDSTPYPLWRQQKVYNKTAKVVWQGRVYQAKWWTRNEQPDAPVKHAWESPWRYLGPVLSSDQRAIDLAALGSDSRAKWTAERVFLTQDEVIHDGMVFRSKWWTQGQEPEVLPERSYDHPWQYLGSLSCEDGSCIESGMGAALVVDFGGLMGVQLEVRESDGRPGIAGRLIQKHEGQGGEKTYNVLRDAYDLVFSVGSAQFVLDSVDCREGHCRAEGIASTLSVDYDGMTDVALEVRVNDEVPGMTGNLVQSETEQNGQKTYKVLRSSYDLVFRHGPSELILDAIECGGEGCTAGEIVSTLFVDYGRLSNIGLEIRQADGVEEMAGDLVVASQNQSGQKTYRVLRNTYDLIFKMASSSFGVDGVDCRDAHCVAGPIAATLSVDFGGLSDVQMEIREADGRLGTAGSLLALHESQSGRKTYHVLENNYDLVFNKGSAELVMDTVRCKTGACRARGISAELLVEYGPLPASMELRADDGHVGTTGGLVEAHEEQSGSQRYPVLRGSYDIALKDGGWASVEDAIDCTDTQCQVKVKGRKRTARPKRSLEVTALEAELAVLIEQYTDQHPNVIALRRRLEELGVRY